MSKGSQSILATLLGAMLLGVAASSNYLNFVRPWTRYPLLFCGILLLTSSIGPALARRPDHDTAHASRLSWLLLAPVLVVFVIHPPALGAYIAEHQADELPPPAKVRPPVVVANTPTPFAVFDFVMTAAYDDSDFLDGLKVKMVGFASFDSDGNWYITRLSITCCAADAQSSRVKVTGAPAPPANTWVRLIGTWVNPHTPVPRKTKASVKALSVTRIKKPKDPYES